jgi:hypothetical protein
VEFNLIREDGSVVRSTVGFYDGASWLEVSVDSSGGTGEEALNPDYPEAILLLLGKLGRYKATIVGVVLNSRPVADLSLSSRILTIEEFPYPIQLERVADFSGLRLAIAAATARQLSQSSKGGNPRRRLSLIVTLPGKELMDSQAFAPAIDARSVN